MAAGKSYGSGIVNPVGDGPHGNKPFSVELRECACGYIYAQEDAHKRDSLPHADDDK